LLTILVTSLVTKRVPTLVTSLVATLVIFFVIKYLQVQSQETTAKVPQSSYVGVTATLTGESDQ
jgi:hypothetical protein